MTPTRPDPSALGTVLGVWAHPDDETYLSAGIMTMAVDAGARVVCVTATRGENGTPDPERWPPAELARTRGAELAAALATLGVDEHHWLDYPDGRCAAVDPEEGVRRVLDVVDDVRPDTVLTFGPDGMTGHRDHKTVCAWTTEAMRRRDDGRARLHYATVEHDWIDDYLEVMVEAGVYEDGARPSRTRSPELSIDFRLPPAIHERKLAALRAQPSQVEPLVAAVGDDVYRGLTAAEFFRAGDLRAAVAMGGSRAPD
ncbi:MAG: PIG-L deacetylase family protein [Acidimicrobiia bacterium]